MVSATHLNLIFFTLLYLTAVEAARIKRNNVAYRKRAKETACDAHADCKAGQEYCKAVPNEKSVCAPIAITLNGVCTWKVTDAAVPTVQVEQAQCDDTNAKFKTDSVTMITETFTFKGEDTCQIVVDNFMKSKCEGDNSYTKVHSTPTDGGCAISTQTESGLTQVEDAKLVCDAEKKSYVTTQRIEVNHERQYGQEEQCSVEVQRWIEGLEKTHKGACAEARRNTADGEAPNDDDQDTKDQKPSQAPSEEDDNKLDAKDGDSDDSSKTQEGSNDGSNDDSSKTQPTTKKPAKSNALATAASSVQLLLGVGALSVFSVA